MAFTAILYWRSVNEYYAKSGSVKWLIHSGMAYEKEAEMDTWGACCGGGRG